MKISFNGKEEVLAEGKTLKDLLVLKGHNPDTIIVEYNYGLVKKEAWDGIVLKENDVIEVLRFVGGG